MTNERVPEYLAAHVAPIMNNVQDLFSTMRETYNPDTCEAVVQRLGKEYLALTRKKSEDWTETDEERFGHLVHFSHELFFTKAIDDLYANYDTRECLSSLPPADSLRKELRTIRDLQHRDWYQTIKPFVDALEQRCEETEQQFAINNRIVEESRDPHIP